MKGANDAPAAANDAYATQEDQVLSITPAGVLTNDLDRDGDILQVDVGSSDTTSNLGADITFQADGSFVYDPTNAPLIRNLAPGETATDTFTYTAIDPSGAMDTATVSITLSGVNSAPVATDKTYNTDEDTVLDGVAPGVMTGDYDPDGQNISVLDYDTTSTLGATVAVNADGSFSYDPTTSDFLQTLNTSLTVTDAFTYTIVDDDVNAKTATATIRVTVSGVNDAPVATDDSALVPRNSVATLTILANDSDIDGTIDASTVTVETDPAHGTATVLANGTIRYEPTSDYSGDDVLTYTVRDNSGAVSNVASVSLRVNAAPVAENDTIQTFRNVPITMGVLANDHDVDGTLDPTSIVVVDQPLHGAASITANGNIIYTPNSNFVGNDTLTYTVQDDIGVVSNVATVSIAVITDPFPWQNPNNALDVNNDGTVSPIDVLLLISDLNKNGSRNLPNPPVVPNVPPPYLDVSGDNKISPIDALEVISFLNSPQGEGEGEATSVASGVVVAQPPAMVLPLATSPIGQQPAATPSDIDTFNPLNATDNRDDFTLRIGQPGNVRHAAIDSFLSSSAFDETLEELVQSGRGDQEELLEDQALLELLLGNDTNN